MEKEEHNILVQDGPGSGCYCGEKAEIVYVPEGMLTEVSTLAALKSAAQAFHEGSGTGPGQTHSRTEDGREMWSLAECYNPNCVRMKHLIEQFEKLPKFVHEVKR